MTRQDTTHSRQSAWTRTLANTTALLIIAGSICLLVADTLTRVRYDEKLFAVADNLFVVGAGLSFVLALTYIRADQATRISWSLRRRVISSLAGGVIALLVVLAVNFFYYNSIGTFQLALSIVFGLSISTLLFNVMTPFSSQESPLSRSAEPEESHTEFLPPNGQTVTMPSRLVYIVYALLAMLIVVGVVLRVLMPGIGILTWVVAPINLFLTPGLSLALALLPTSARWIERLIFAPALSIGAQLLAITWLSLLGIPIHTPAFFIIAAGVTLAGILSSFFRRRALTST